MKVAIGLMTLLVVMACSAPTPTPTVPLDPTPTATPTPEPWNLVIVGACTGSMEPTITCLDTVYAWRGNVPEEDLRVGMMVDVENVEGNRVPYVHRIIDLRPGEVLTKGDGFPDDDGWVPVTRIRGYVVSIEKNTRPYNAEMRDYVNTARTAYIAAEAAYEETALQYCPDPYNLSGCDSTPAEKAEIEVAYTVARNASCEYLTRTNHALVYNAEEIGVAPPPLSRPATC